MALLTCGISAILNKQLSPTCSFESIKQPVELTSIPQISWSKMSRSKLLRSLENDLELVYVAHSCLSWEALHYQYQKVRVLCEKAKGILMEESNVTIFCLDSSR